MVKADNAEISVINTREDFLRLEKAWNGLLETSPTDAVSLTFEWLKAWLDSYGKKSALYILCLAREGWPAALAPCAVTLRLYRGVRARILHFMDSEDTPRMDFLCGGGRTIGEAVDSFVSFFQRQRGEWDVAILRNIPESSSSCAALREALGRSGLRYVVREGLRSPFIRIEAPWEEFLATFSRKFHKTLRNQVNRIQKSLSPAVSLAETPEGLSHVFAVSGRSWKARYKRDLSHSPLAQSFFRSLSAAAAQRGWLNVWQLSVEDKPVAFEFQLRYKDRAYALRSDFDDGYASLSPGVLLQRAALESVFGQGLKVYDFCGHEESYKKRWAREVQPHLHFYFYADTLAGRWSYFWDVRVLFPLGDRLKKFALMRRVKKWLTGVGIT